jgi:hypothetical protein
MTEVTRKNYLAGKVSHQEYYCAVADAIGPNAVDWIVRNIAPVERLQTALAADPHLNNIPLHVWDHRHPAVLALAREAGAQRLAFMHSGSVREGYIAWSLGDSVCVLKAAARRLAEREQQ